MARSPQPYKRRSLHTYFCILILLVIVLHETSCDRKRKKSVKNVKKVENEVQPKSKKLSGRAFQEVRKNKDSLILKEPRRRRRGYTRRRRVSRRATAREPFWKSNPVFKFFNNLGNKIPFFNRGNLKRKATRRRWTWRKRRGRMNNKNIEKGERRFYKSKKIWNKSEEKIRKDKERNKTKMNKKRREIKTLKEEKNNISKEEKAKKSKRSKEKNSKEDKKTKEREKGKIKIVQNLEKLKKDIFKTKGNSESGLDTKEKELEKIGRVKKEDKKEKRKKPENIETKEDSNYNDEVYEETTKKPKDDVKKKLKENERKSKNEDKSEEDITKKTVTSMETHENEVTEAVRGEVHEYEEYYEEVNTENLIKDLDKKDDQTERQAEETGQQEYEEYYEQDKPIHEVTEVIPENFQGNDIAEPDFVTELPTPSEKPEEVEYYDYDYATDPPETYDNDPDIDKPIFPNWYPKPPRNFFDRLFGPKPTTTTLTPPEESYEERRHRRHKEEQEFEEEEPTNPPQEDYQQDQQEDIKPEVTENPVENEDTQMNYQEPQYPDQYRRWEDQIPEESTWRSEENRTEINEYYDSYEKFLKENFSSFNEEYFTEESNHYTDSRQENLFGIQEMVTTTEPDKELLNSTLETNLDLFENATEITELYHEFSNSTDVSFVENL